MSEKVSIADDGVANSLQSTVTLTPTRAAPTDDSTNDNDIPNPPPSTFHNNNDTRKETDQRCFVQYGKKYEAGRVAVTILCHGG